ncbi:HlyD family efflux transporter periplasmic adaptor subunit [Planktothricoides raciborskii GIHE-MW2]|uniref:HlyD family efflux transporter periplasmic adaptor subunit n=4 Tax=Planktothricoides TaxID=132607 RepID=A0AAU8JAJ7_9CYAN|nr:HlyD family efflux transporter periplasmic adaptor subunit [Planktothricoides raciborskii]
MKKLGAIALVVVILLGFGAIGYGIMGRRKPKTDPIAELTVAVEFQNRTVRIQASGTVQPIQSVNLSPKNAGRLEQLRVEQGDRVEAGEIVAIMESKDTSARLVQARARLNRAEARLRELENGNRGEDIAQARARLAQAEASLSELQAGSRGEDIAQARARLAQAQESLAELRAGNRGENIAQARARLAQAQASLAELRAGNRRENIAQARARLAQAQARLTRVKAGSRFEEIAQAEARVVDAQARVELTEVRRKRNQQLADEGAISQDSLDEAVTENRRAQANLQEAQRQLEQLQKNRREELTQAEAEVQEAQQALALQENGPRPEEIARAEAQVQEAQQALALQENGPRPEEIARAEAQVQEAQQALALQENGPRPEEIARAEAQVQEAQQALALQENGPRPETITQAEAEVNEALGQLREVEVQLEDTIIRAPFSGQITQRYATEGAFVTPTTSASSAGQATSTSIVALARGLEILGKVPEADITQIQPGQRVEIVADAYPDQVFTGKVRLIAPEAIKEQDVTLFEVRVDIDSGFEELRSGMNVDVTFLGDELKNALVVPTVAIVTNKGETGVLVPNEKNEAVFRPVTIGPTIGNDIQILSGLESGDRVFVGLPPGQKLEDILKNED